MLLKNSLNFISEFFDYTSSQIRKIYLSSKIYNNKISKIDDKLIEYKPSPNLLDCLIKYLALYLSTAILKSFNESLNFGNCSRGFFGLLSKSSVTHIHLSRY